MNKKNNSRSESDLHKIFRSHFYRSNPIDDRALRALDERAIILSLDIIKETKKK